MLFPPQRPCPAVKLSRVLHTGSGHSITHGARKTAVVNIILSTAHTEDERDRQPDRIDHFHVFQWFPITCGRKEEKALGGTSLSCISGIEVQWMECRDLNPSPDPVPCPGPSKCIPETCLAILPRWHQESRIWFKEAMIFYSAFEFMQFVVYQEALLLGHNWEGRLEESIF